MLIVSERLCCCMDVATGSLLAGIYTCFLSLVFVAIGIDSLVETSRNVHNSQDLAVLNAVYGLLIALSILLGVASVSLVLGAARKLKTYIVMWIIIIPLWTCLAFCHLIVLPISMSHAVLLTDETARTCGTVFILVTNVFCIFCVCLFFTTLVKSPLHKLKSLGVVEALESGFSSGYSRLRESIRPSKANAGAAYRRRSDTTNAVRLPEDPVPVVLDPNQLELTRTNVSGTRREPEDCVQEVSDGYKQHLSSTDQLGNRPQPGGFVNVAFSASD